MNNNNLKESIHQEFERFMRDEMDDLEIEFELIQKHINKLESMPRNATTSEEEVSILVEEEEDEIDIENSSAVPTPKKF